MIRASFNDNWQFRPKVNPFAELAGIAPPFEPVTVPHDAMITRDREATADGAATAYFPGGAYEYRKTFFAPEEHRGKRITLEFEGVYRDATVFVNGNYAGQRPYGYSRFFIDADRFLRFGENNEVRVECRTHQDSRWYSGAGIYRDTWLLVGEVVRISPDGVHVTTPDIPRPTGPYAWRSPATEGCSASAAPTRRTRSGSTRPSTTPTRAARSPW
ncbi:sugar-binding domain-containing protein [Nonomuraea sp. NPDC049028]|uniref:sugar-binding domain-containing protein n=1 Tax=Nonomuraea sp. NPDC049028 TaxID=3364348 RepID=UPI00370FD68A